LPAKHTVINGKFLVENRELTPTGVDDMLNGHRGIAQEWLDASRTL